VKYILPEMLTEDRQFILLGTGEPELENFFRNMQSMHPKKVRAFIQYDKDLSKKIYAGADMFLMPSKSEPCGLAQMICSEYGTVPIVRETGGLADTIQPYNRYTGEGNGFTFRNYNAHEMKDAVERAEELYRDTEKWKQFCADIMKIDFSWNVSAEKYRQIYQSLLD
jgi:starch synthase